MIPLIQNRFQGYHFTVYQNDVLNINITHGDSSNLKKGIHVIRDSKIITLPQYNIYGNIPYYITSPILHHFFYDVELSPEVATFTMQKEVANRILDTKNHTVLSLSCQLVSKVEKVCDISPHNFTPVPKVWSTCLRFTKIESPTTEDPKKIL